MGNGLGCHLGLDSPGTRLEGVQSKCHMSHLHVLDTRQPLRDKNQTVKPPKPSNAANKNKQRTSRTLQTTCRSHFGTCSCIWIDLHRHLPKVPPYVYKAHTAVTILMTIIIIKIAFRGFGFSLTPGNQFRHRSERRPAGAGQGADGVLPEVGVREAQGAQLRAPGDV